MLKIPAKVRFLSCEPLLCDLRLKVVGNPPIHLNDRIDGVTYNKIDWLIAGGESGPVARPMHPDWARCLRDQCVEADVPFLFKQWGDWAPTNGNKKKGEFHFFLDGQAMKRVGKKAAGRLLDGKEWNQFPTT